MLWAFARKYNAKEKKPLVESGLHRADSTDGEHFPMSPTHQLDSEKNNRLLIQEQKTFNLTSLMGVKI